MLLQRGHLPAPSNETGRVKCFVYWHCLHIHRIECSSWDWLICCNACSAMSRIPSRAAVSLLSAESISSVPIVEVCFSVCGYSRPKTPETCSDVHPNISTADGVMSRLNFLARPRGHSTKKKKAISQKRFALIVQILSAPEAVIGTTNLHYQLRLQHSSWLTTRLTLQFCVKPSLFTASSKLLAHHQPYRFALAG